ncbi:DUF3857 domain-containing protein [candidate division KSB1 bacterium]|nr:DUF3857 domain-containing protein [candidate division KSB1 bacterium]
MRKKFFLVLWLFWIYSLLWSQTELPDYIKNAPGMKEYPNQEALVLKQEMTITLHPDGKITRHYLTAHKILTDYFIGSRACDPKISWNTASQKLKIIQARSYMSDGQVVDCQANALNQITPFELDRAPDYMHLQQLVVTHVGVERLATLVLEYEITDSIASTPFWGEEIELQTDKPILNQKITIIIPESINLKYATINLQFEPQMKTQGGQKVYTFERQNIPPINFMESNVPVKEHLQRLVFSTFEDWAAVSAQLRNNVIKALDNAPSIKKAAEKLVQGKLSVQEKIDAIHQFVVSQTHPVQWPLNDFGFKPQPASRVYESGYGHDLDRAVLLVALLGEVGIASEMALFSSTISYAANVPTPVSFSEVRVKVKDVPDEIWLSPSKSLDQQNLYHLQGLAYIDLSEKKSQLSIYQYDSAPNSCAVSGTLELKRENDNKSQLCLSGTLEMELSGKYNPYIRPTEAEKQMKRLGEKIASSLSGAKVTGQKIIHLAAEKSIFQLEIQGGKVSAKNNFPFEWVIPQMMGSILEERLSLHRSQRTLPLAVFGPLTEKFHLTIKLPTELKVINQPADYQKEVKCGSAMIKVSTNDQQLIFERELKINNRWISPSEYPDFREMFLRLLGEKESLVMFK